MSDTFHVTFLLLKAYSQNVLYSAGFHTWFYRLITAGRLSHDITVLTENTLGNIKMPVSQHPLEEGIILNKVTMANHQNHGQDMFNELSMTVI
jgi:hypothetical protein